MSTHTGTGTSNGSQSGVKQHFSYEERLIQTVETHSERSTKARSERVSGVWPDHSPNKSNFIRVEYYILIVGGVAPCVPFRCSRTAFCRKHPTIIKGIVHPRMKSKSSTTQPP